LNAKKDYGIQKIGSENSVFLPFSLKANYEATRKYVNQMSRPIRESQPLELQFSGIIDNRY